MNRRGQLAGWEALIIIILLGACGWMFYLYAHKPSQANIYALGSKPIVTEASPSFGGCVSIGVERMRDANSNKTNR